MDTSILNILLATTGLGTLAWIIWQKLQGRPWLAKWLTVVCLLLLPIFLAKWLAPAAWMDIRTMPVLFWFVAILPFLLGAASFGGGLLLILGLILHAFFDAVGEVDWSSYEDKDYPSYHDYHNQLDWLNDWKYEFYRKND